MKLISAKTGCSKQNGFTLIEILVASIIGVFVAIVAVSTLRAISVSAEIVNTNIDKASEIRFAAKMISRDLSNICRERNFDYTKFIGTPDGDGGGGGNLTFYTTNKAKVRAGQPEGDIYEVQYFLLKNQERNMLVRRLQPNPAKEEQEEKESPVSGVESGSRGVLTVIAEDIDVFKVMYFDGSTWLSEWDIEQNRIPEIVTVTIGGRKPEKGFAAMESIFINLTRGNGGQISDLQSDEKEEEQTNTQQ